MNFNNYLDIFKAPKSIFTSKFKNMDEIAKDCIYILDTNILLFPYTVGNKELHEISKVYKQLLDNDKLYIPSQVAKEFAKNRPQKLQEMYQGLSDYLSRIEIKPIPRYQLLLNETEYKDALVIEKQIQESNKAYKNAIKRILEYIKKFNWDDPVSNMYSTLFTEKFIIENSWKYNELLEELKNRHKFNIPPAYKDKGKDDGGIGDYIIWKDILELAKGKKVDIIFVTGDEKADWFHQSMNNKLYPKYELLQEFKFYTNGKDICFTDLSTLIELYSNDKTVVESIKIIEGSNKIRRGSFLTRRRALENANFTCGICKEDAKSYHDAGQPYLEIHHIKPLTQGGEDSLDNILVLCPNCHRKVHNSNLPEFTTGSPCQMSEQSCPSCKVGILDVSEGQDGVRCNKCGAYWPAGL